MALASTGLRAKVGERRSSLYQTKMLFDAPRGRAEWLWVAKTGQREFRVLTVPIWVYGISVGTLVTGRIVGSRLHFNDLAEPSPGGTCRILTQAGQVASELYLNIVGPKLAAEGVSVGPASFYDPAIVGVHFKNRARVEMLRAVLNEFEADSAFETWELADPANEETPGGEEVDEHDVEEPAPPLDHDPPSTRRERLWTFDYD
jgi:hypothetical protein